MSESREVRHEADRIERNRASAPTTVRLADVIFDVARQLDSDRLEECAILVDADAQRGVEYTVGDIARLTTRVKSLIIEAGSVEP
jgi:hypothetical protein